jgi:hypothetical protein
MSCSCNETAITACLGTDTGGIGLHLDSSDNDEKGKMDIQCMNTSNISPVRFFISFTEQIKVVNAELQMSYSIGWLNELFDQKQVETHKFQTLFVDTTTINVHSCVYITLSGDQPFSLSSRLGYYTFDHCTFPDFDFGVVDGRAACISFTSCTFECSSLPESEMILLSEGNEFSIPARLPSSLGCRISRGLVTAVAKDTTSRSPRKVTTATAVDYTSTNELSIYPTPSEMGSELAGCTTCLIESCSICILGWALAIISSLAAGIFLCRLRKEVKKSSED